MKIKGEDEIIQCVGFIFFSSIFLATKQRREISVCIGDLEERETLVSGKFHVLEPFAECSGKRHCRARPFEFWDIYTEIGR